MSSKLDDCMFLNVVGPLLDPFMLKQLLKFMADRGIDVKVIQEALNKQLYLSENKIVSLPLSVENKPDEKTNKLIDAERDIVSLISAAESILSKYYEELPLENYAHQKTYKVTSTITPELLEGNITVDALNALVKLAGYFHARGDFEGASELLRLFENFATMDCKECPAIFTEEMLKNVRWGLLCNYILAEKWGLAKDWFDHLWHTMQRTNCTNIERAWLMHWALFICFHGERPSCVIDLIFRLSEGDTRVYLNILESGYEYYIRYVIMANITTSKKYFVRQILSLISRISHIYSDPITELAIKLWQKFDFENALQHFDQVKSAIENDFFLSKHKDKIIESTIEVIMEGYIRTHKKIPIEYIAKNLKLKPEEAEVWAAKLISKVNINAKIDLVKNELIVSSSSKDTYERVLQYLETSHRNALLANKE